MINGIGSKCAERCIGIGREALHYSERRWELYCKRILVIWECWWRLSRQCIFVSMPVIIERVLLMLLLLWLLMPVSRLHPAQTQQHLEVKQSSPTIILGTPLSLQLPGQETSLPIIISKSNDDTNIQKDLQRGLALLPKTIEAEHSYQVITGHSSGPSAFGPYRLAFSRLSSVAIGDSIRLHTVSGDGIYVVWKKETVWPWQIDTIPVEETAGVSLVTCWPPGTNLKRLLVHARLDHLEP